MNHITFSIDDSTGDTTFLLNDDTRAFVDSTSVIKRASHVEPVNLFIRIVFYTIRFLFGEHGRAGDFTRQWPCRWRVNLSPVGGPLIPVEWASRQSAINFEVRWLEENFL